MANSIANNGDTIFICSIEFGNKTINFFLTGTTIIAMPENNFGAIKLNSFDVAIDIHIVIYW